MKGQTNAGYGMEAASLCLQTIEIRHATSFLLIWRFLPEEAFWKSDFVLYSFSKQGPPI
jgi:hypothetical protein